MGLFKAGLSKVAGVLALAAIAGAGWYSTELARADAAFREGTPESVARAAELAPRNTAYLALRALQTEYAGGDATPLLERLAQVTPRASAPRIRLGLNEEARGDAREAERWLLDAARVDHQYEPRWTLANFYFRQQSMDEFWKWLRAALEVSYGDRSAAFRLALSADPSGALLLAQALPSQHDVLAAYLWYLLGLQTGPDLTPVALRLSQAHDPADRVELDSALDRLAGHGSPGAVLEIWGNLGHPTPVGIIFNPDFGPAHIGHGLDWRFVENPGVRFAVIETPPALRISFDGMQPESCVLIEQHVGVKQGKRYAMRWQSRGVSSGLGWSVGGVAGGLRANQDWVRGELAFTAAQDSEAVELRYARPLGEARVEGSLELRHVTIEEHP